MSQNHEKHTPILGYLLLRDGHAIPLAGISPDQIKAGSKQVIPNYEEDSLAHRKRLNAIVDRLGFSGDFGTFKNQGWAQFQQFLRREACHQQTSLFTGCGDLFLRPERRALADRIFESDQPVPERVFLGYGVDWEGLWGPNPPYMTRHHAPGKPPLMALYARRFDLINQLGFIDDKLIWGEVEEIIDHTYWHQEVDEKVRAANRADLFDAVRALRTVIDTFDNGWIRILPYNERLAILRAPDGSWDLLWRAYRAHNPPEPASATRFKLALEDLPSLLKQQLDNERFIYLRQGVQDGERVWDEWEAHHAEQAFYDRGQTPGARQATSSVEVRMAWLREQDFLNPPRKQRLSAELPAGFRRVEINGQQLAISELISVADYRRMLDETGYLTRRAESQEPWERCNQEDPRTAPVGASWLDAQAYCAWQEHKHGVLVRLPTHQELRAIHPFYNEHYAQFGALGFPWENYPPKPLSRGDEHGSPRIDVPSAVQWSEPRFLEPGPDLDEFPSPDGSSSRSRRRFITDFPPRATWLKNLPQAEYHGLRFIDAWDAGEWCQTPGRFHGRFCDGVIAKNSWGAYKNLKITFRIVLELED